MRVEDSADSSLFFIGLFSAVLGLISFLLILVLLPYVLFDATSTVPDFVLRLSDWLSEHENYNLEGVWHRLALLSPFLLGSGVLFLISWYATVRLEGKDEALAAVRLKSIDVTSEAGSAPKTLLDRYPGVLIFSLLLLFIGGFMMLEFFLGIEIL
ncbi:MAG: hypothetical protein ACD_44C00326G0014 [uncultured bacterium]|nr:MAG: hypothetical protein ACD_44C00326G0014 [uncultured bacterium]OGT15705.1 MAG: hypothetical protein A3B69_04600 [Gammaproteobacteria bacterium RIFCSPHIGHO2_02_FULL_38_33]OGT23719.1 MAG: hypothetical protein A2W47_04695 [Gammaproteobacteria bacterium RIFCSPHIGHO2_12_38_15]OGT67803.1 MAG: hypothetical protein A3I12_01775 [Gammaproteobacteria bacterium RIFCSPLOWO2_02_FULL_38_11]OGT75779.1 MAG: hypothetical protein A3G71_06895 [Gammaproteobacteria bacterium RIFCSPLOWO2_12_FULL_38_14]